MSSARLGKERVVASTTTNNVAPRARISLNLGMKTFGTSHYIEMTTRDVSLSGLLVSVNDPKVIPPFQPKTLLELVLYPDGDILREEVKMTAVVVRSVVDEVDRTRKLAFGVRVVDAPEVFDQIVDAALKDIN